MVSDSFNLRLFKVLRLSCKKAQVYFSIGAQCHLNYQAVVTITRGSPSCGTVIEYVVLKHFLESAVGLAHDNRPAASPLYFQLLQAVIHIYQNA